MEENPLIVFDVPGVLLSDGIPHLLRALSRRGVRWNEKAYSGWYHDHIESPLLRGEMSPKDFWTEMLDNQGIPLDEIDEWKDFFKEHTVPLVDEKSLRRWNSKAQLAIVSNGLPEWFAVPLRQVGVQRMIPLSQVVLSANYMTALPGKEMFQTLLDLLPEEPDSVVYVSAAADHGLAAEEFGWSWVHADREGVWTWELDDHLNLSDPERDSDLLDG